ncbi:hypothetical protein SDC9_142199 [bioreactor metagenome]|uniref:Uncharacterized protein n=1 Tax=bioreactor metagenome TaxID=1076179 RepID=A0A645E100_9ZZZZ
MLLALPAEDLRAKANGKLPHRYFAEPRGPEMSGLMNGDQDAKHDDG